MTEFDYRTPERRKNLRYTTSTMLKLGVVPILNENDAVSGNEGYEADGMFSDNDGLAALVAEQVCMHKDGCCVEEEMVDGPRGRSFGVWRGP